MAWSLLWITFLIRPIVIEVIPGFDATDLANLYLTDLFRHHCLPRIIISDRNLRFMPLF
jgi:hypothetical protein